MNVTNTHAHNDKKLRDPTRKSGIKVSYAPDPSRADKQIVSIRYGQSPLLVGHIEHCCGLWHPLARADNHAWVRKAGWFKSRSDAAKWLLINGGFTDPDAPNVELTTVSPPIAEALTAPALVSTRRERETA